MALGQKVELDIEDSDPITVTYSAVDLRRYESQFHKSVLVEPMSLTMLTFLGWSAARRQGLLNGHYEKWVDFDAVCTSVKTIADDAEGSPDPPKPTRTRKKAAATPPTASDG